MKIQNLKKISVRVSRRSLQSEKSENVVHYDLKLIFLELANIKTMLLPNMKAIVWRFTKCDCRANHVRARSLTLFIVRCRIGRATR